MNWDYFAAIDKDSGELNWECVDEITARYHRLIAEGKKKDADGVRAEWSKKSFQIKLPEPTGEVWQMIAHPNPDLSILPPFSFFICFRFKLATPYISKDDNPFYIIDNPIVRDRVFRLPMVRSTSWKGNLYSALWQLGHDKQNDAQMQRIFGDIRGENEEQSGRAGRLFFYPTFFMKTSLEIINPHDRRRRVGKNPILFESVTVGAEGEFRLLYVPFDHIGYEEPKTRRQVADDLKLIAQGVQAMFRTYGFSAKRTSGYGTASDAVESGQLIHKIPGATFLQGSVLQTQKPEDVFLKYLDETGRVKPAFAGSGEGGLMSNSEYGEYKKTGAQAAGGGSISEFKKFRAWYVAYGKSWQASLQHSATSTDYPAIPFESLSQLVELCQDMESDTTNGGAA